jgi:putative tricarboxylic transport membrane protein
MQFKRIKDLIFGCAALILSVFYLVCSTQIKTRPKLTPGYASARIVPVLLGILLAVLSVLCLIQGVRKLKTKAGEEPHDQPRKGDVTAVLLTFAVIIAYIAALSPLGFCLSTALYLFVQMLVLAPKDKRNVALFAAVSVVFTAVIFVAFRIGLQQLLPRGVIESLLGF